ncbi:MAG: exodeoxyribonuclease V subunit gamma, partial [Planctomycetota bacterium]
MADARVERTPPGAQRHLRVVRASCADALADDLAGCFRGPHAPGPLDRCVVAVQGPGLGRWLRVEMARRLGAWGGVETPFLRAFLLDLACAGSEIAAPRGREDIDQLTFRIAATLNAAARGQGPVQAEAMRPVLRMVRDARGTVDQAGLLRVSRRLAEAFDRYEVDRPQVVTEWKQGRSALDAKAPERMRELEAWQRPLWCATAAEGASHAAWSRLRQFVSQLERGAPPDGVTLPALVSVFGVSLLSPFMVRALQALGRHTTVVLHLLTPTQAFVAERASRRQILWEAAEAGLSEAEVERALAFEAGHPLLDAMGRQAVEAQRVLLDAEVALHAETDESDAAAPPSTMLGQLQHDLLHDAAASAIEPDASIAVHAVSTPHRAAEVAHDAVMAAFAEIPHLRPERVAILTPDIVGIGNAIESVFAQRGQLPLTAADARLARPGSGSVALRHVLQAVVEGLTMAGVQSALGQPAVLTALRLRPDSLGRWLDRLEEAGARRFLDATDRAARLERPVVRDDRLHTLQWAVDRVVLGMAVGCESDPLDPASLAGPMKAVDPDLLPSQAPGSASLEELHRVVQAIETIAQFV